MGGNILTDEKDCQMNFEEKFVMLINGIVSLDEDMSEKVMNMLNIDRKKLDNWCVGINIPQDKSKRIDTMEKLALLSSMRLY